MELKKATFAAGCFWGVEAAFRHVDGVVSAAVGYSGGQAENPTYRQVCTGRTGHAESVEVEFDPAKISFPELLDVFWSSHDPTTLNRQGPDIGTQYRSVIFFHDAEQERQARESMREVDESGTFRHRIVTQIVPAAPFYPAEDYHQRYFEKQGVDESCHVGPASVHTRLAAQAGEQRLAAAPPPTVCEPSGADCGVVHWDKLDDQDFRARLTPEQYHIARQAGTERAFTGKYWNEHRPGLYRCAVCGQSLFSSETKFDSGTGWPSFSAPLEKGAVTERSDISHGMVRTEVVCSNCQSHLGHVFFDGPKPAGLRYCMNSAVLDFVPQGSTEKPSRVATDEHG